MQVQINLQIIIKHLAIFSLIFRVHACIYNIIENIQLYIYEPCIQYVISHNFSESQYVVINSTHHLNDIFKWTTISVHQIHEPLVTANITKI